VLKNLEEAAKQWGIGPMVGVKNSPRPGAFFNGRISFAVQVT
jgi:hypothetical protein